MKRLLITFLACAIPLSIYFMFSVPYPEEWIAVRIISKQYILYIVIMIAIWKKK